MTNNVLLAVFPLTMIGLATYLIYSALTRYHGWRRKVLIISQSIVICACLIILFIAAQGILSKIRE